MIRAIVMSDSHGNDKAIRKIIADNPDADYYLHCGDFDSDISAFPMLTAVCGNHDEDDGMNLPLERILNICGHRILMLHSHKYVFSLLNYRRIVAEKGRENNCDIVLFGHVHYPLSEIINGIRIINPGSLLFNYDLVKIGYMVLTFEQDGSYQVQRIILPDEYQSAW
ncbi:MAG: YfcE family phosphodiesterase [Erysipelotrichaceae bacterium]|nr:YfcE family phosphodiesterase [Erysipelotrichaceae bacterium]MBQ4253538.1 YfcE family phosphodiesterase [Erysipelotrichaceae bacterium]